MYAELGLPPPITCVLSGEVFNSDVRARFVAAGAAKVRGSRSVLATSAALPAHHGM